MAVDLTAYPAPSVRSAAMDANPGDCTAVTLARNCARVTLEMYRADDTTTDTMQWSWVGVDSAAIGTHAMKVQAGESVTIQVWPGVAPAHKQRIIYIAAGTASALCKIEQEA